MLSRMNKLGKKADNFAHGIKEHGKFASAYTYIYIYIYMRVCLYIRDACEPSSGVLKII